MSLVVTTINGEIHYKNPPNGGWGWIVVAASFFILGNAFGTSKGLGIYFLDIKLQFDASNSTTSWISSCYIGALGLAGLFTGIMSKWMDARKIIITGGLLACLGLVIAALAPNMVIIIIACLISGLGHGIAFIMCTSQVSLYFGKLRPLANGIILSGSSVFSTAMPYFNTYLLQNYGWRGSFLILAAIGLNTCMLGSLIRPIKNVSKTESDVEDRVVEVRDADDKETVDVITKKTWTPTLFITTYWVALMLLFSNVILDLSLFVPNIFLVPYAKYLGLMETDAAMLLSFLSIGDIVCRPLSGFLLTHFDRIARNILVYIGVISFLISLNQLIAVFSSSLTLLMLYTIVHGCLYGLLTTAAVTSVPMLMGTKQIEKLYGIFFAVGSFAILASAPIAGALVDALGNYNVAYWYCLICLCVTGMLCLVSHIIIRVRGGIVLKR